VKGRRGYAADFKQRVLKRLATGEVSLRQAAKEFDVSVPTLIKWRQGRTSAKPLAAQAPRREASAPVGELERLRAEVEQLKEERDRLRQGIAIIAGIGGKVTS